MSGGAVSVSALLDDAAARVTAALGLERRESRLEARVLAAAAWAVSPAWLIAHGRDPVGAALRTRFDALLARRIAGEPTAYLTGTREFYGRPFAVTPDVLIPRPDTELLVELALERMPADAAVDALDLGTGSGCIAVTLALGRPRARVTAVDRSPAALGVAHRNAEMLGASVEFLESCWFAAVADRNFDIIVSNPPYVPLADPHLTRGDVRFEPQTALASGADGLADLRHLVRLAPDYLRPGGTLLLEHGYDQAETVCRLLQDAGFREVTSWRDLAGIARVSGGILSK